MAMFDHNLVYDYSDEYLEDPSFSRMPLEPLDSYDFSQRASVFLQNKRVNIDLMVQSVSMNYDEHSQVEMHMGDTFSTLFFGKAPLEVRVGCILPDYTENYGKAELIEAYKNKLRATAVAKSGIVPIFKCKEAYFEGPWVRLNISETSETEDIITVEISILVTKLSVMGDNSVSQFNYTTGYNYTNESFNIPSASMTYKGMAFIGTGKRDII